MNQPTEAAPTKVPNKEVEEAKMVHEFSEKPKDQTKMVKTVGIIAIIVALGTLTGYVASNASSKGESDKSGNGTIHQIVKTDKIVGSTDSKTFRDKAEGTLQKGGIDGEGTHKLVRPGGDSQTVYLTSSVIDLNEYVGKKVRVWGETFAAQKAGWLMDVGKVELL